MRCEYSELLAEHCAHCLKQKGSEEMEASAWIAQNLWVGA